MMKGSLLLKVIILAVTVAVSSGAPNVVIGNGQVNLNPINVRSYYIQAEEVEWDYLPLGYNAMDDDERWKDVLVNGPDRVGSVYTKLVYNQYTDNTFGTLIPKPPHQGYVGPMIHVEVGDVVVVYFRNACDRNVTIHPHGVKYDKASEGALYLDGTAGNDKGDDAVQPGTTRIQTWSVEKEFAPEDGDPPCIPMAYHSHLSPAREISAGLLGLLIVCKKGVLNKEGKRSDVNREVVIYADSINEADSWNIQKNLAKCGDEALCTQLYNDGDADFHESLAKDSINGFMFGNLPGLDICEGENVVFYVFGLEAELHPINIFGQTFVVRHHRTSVVGIYPATFRVLEMTAVNIGRWVIQCLNSEHNRNGMRAFMTVSDCNNFGETRNYYLCAEVEDWNYAPSGVNMFDSDNGDLTDLGSNSQLYYDPNYDGNNLIGGTYQKSRYIRYTDAFFNTTWAIPDREQHLAILGPVIRAQVGDTIKIVLKNLTPKPVSIYLPGTKFDYSQSGMLLKSPGVSSTLVGHVVEPGNVDTYTFTIPATLSPEAADPPCVSHMYFSTVNMERDVSSGLVGPFVLCRYGHLDTQTDMQKYVDREMFLFFSSVDENWSWHIDDNINRTGAVVDKTDETFVESNIMRSINGRSYGNLEGLDMCKGDIVVWHVMSFGNTDGLHGATINGNNVLIDGIYRDSQMTISGLNFVGVMDANNVGNWSVWCQNSLHFNTGMTAVYHVDECGNTNPIIYPSSGVTRTYYIAVVEEQWNFSPSTIHPLDGSNNADPASPSYIWFRNDCPFLGSTYTKALYREFTDATFANRVPVTPETEHLGVIGPIVRGNVGDSIEIVFKNMASRPYSVHAQGLFYEKTDEGMPYQDGQGPTPGDAVAPGDTFTYLWKVPESSGPGPNGPNCVGSMYHSDVDPVKDTYSGLIGLLSICRPGILDINNQRTDAVDVELAMLFMAFDENQSWYIDENINNNNCFPVDTTDEDFIESNKYDAINGLTFSNIVGLTAHLGDKIAWYILGKGTDEDIHTAHFHGQTFIYSSSFAYTGDVMEVGPGTYETIEMFATNPGIWLIHCHVGAHTGGGMIAKYRILSDRRISG